MYKNLRRKFKLSVCHFTYIDIVVFDLSKHMGRGFIFKCYRGRGVLSKTQGKVSVLIDYRTEDCRIYTKQTKHQ